MNFRSEAEFQEGVRELFLTHGWLVGHTHDSRRSAPGEPDCRMVHHRRREMIFAELKMPRGVLSWEQVQWLDALSLVWGSTYLWYPQDWDQIILRAKRISTSHIRQTWRARRDTFDLDAIHKRWERQQVKKGRVKR